MGFSPARVVLHSAALASMTYAYLNLQNLVIYSRIKDQFGGHWQYLTIDGYHLLALPLNIGLITRRQPCVGMADNGCEPGQRLGARGEA